MVVGSGDVSRAAVDLSSLGARGDSEPSSREEEEEEEKVAPELGRLRGEARSAQKAVQAFFERTCFLLEVYILAGCIGVACCYGGQRGPSDVGEAFAAIAAFVAGALLCVAAAAVAGRLASDGGLRTALALSRAQHGSVADGASVQGEIWASCRAAGCFSSGLAGFAFACALLIVQPWRGLRAAVRVGQCFGFGASFAAVLLRAAGGVLAAAAGLSAEFLGYPESAVAAEQVRVSTRAGLLLSAVAGAAAGHFETYACAVAAAVSLGSAAAADVAYPLWLCAGGFVSAAGSFAAFALRWPASQSSGSTSSSSSLLQLRLFSSGVASLVFLACAAVAAGLLYDVQSGRCWRLFGCAAVGSIAGFATCAAAAGAWTTNSALGGQGGPVRAVYDRARTGSAPALILGLGAGMVSAAPSATALALCLIAAASLEGAYGVAVAAVASVATGAAALCGDCLGPVAELAASLAAAGDSANASGEAVGVLLLSGKDAGAAAELARLCAPGGDGACLGPSVLTSVAMLLAVRQASGSVLVEVSEPLVLAAALAGAMLPFVYAAQSLLQVGGIAVHTATEAPQGRRCVSALVRRSVSAALAPTAAAVLPLLLAALLAGVRALSGYVLGIVASAPLLALSLQGAAGAWRGARLRAVRKSCCACAVERGCGSEGSRSAALETADAVGAAFRDAAGPSLDSLPKLTATLALLLAPVLDGLSDWETWPAGLGALAVTCVCLLVLTRSGLLTWEDPLEDQPPPFERRASPSLSEETMRQRRCSLESPEDAEEAALGARGAGSSSSSGPCRGGAIVKRPARSSSLSSTRSPSEAVASWDVIVKLRLRRVSMRLTSQCPWLVELVTDIVYTRFCMMIVWVVGVTVLGIIATIYVPGPSVAAA
eukprot:TRINITY_DN9197_c1_g1_i1.p1 TRINITY_DN9197_c1_g1~~TRINITY_DN9197_c1_g1_i1.p1  ORF type:complete len:885 (+),score=194.21 TRINITY_DN9197_c1_g1_i1:96-2750(+)